MGHKNALDIDFNGRTLHQSQQVQLHLASRPDAPSGMTQEETATTFPVLLGSLMSWFDVYQRMGS